MQSKATRFIGLSGILFGLVILSSTAALASEWHTETDTFGRSASGYKCIHSDGNMAVACTQHRGDECVQDNFGHVQCGWHCQVGDVGMGVSCGTHPSHHHHHHWHDE